MNPEQVEFNRLATMASQRGLKLRRGFGKAGGNYTGYELLIAGTSEVVDTQLDAEEVLVAIHSPALRRRMGRD